MVASLVQQLPSKEDLDHGPAQPADQYLAYNSLHTYVSDACQVVQHAVDDSQLDMTAALAEYFRSVVCAQHLAGRDYAFVIGAESLNDELACAWR